MTDRKLLAILILTALALALPYAAHAAPAKNSCSQRWLNSEKDKCVPGSRCRNKCGSKWSQYERSKSSGKKILKS